MEQNISILIADLSGYTALTETHGAAAAANTIDKFWNIVFDSLVGKTKVHQCIGDEVMMVSDSADDLLETAVLLNRNSLKENHFLQLHGGLHYGKILIHNNNYFGLPVNQTSRIAA